MELRNGQCFKVSSRSVAALSHCSSTFDFVVKVLSVDHAHDKALFKLSRIIGPYNNNLRVVSMVKKVVEGIPEAVSNNSSFLQDPMFKWESFFMSWISKRVATPWQAR